jgi:HK97 family phage major capsid protein
MEKTLEQKAQAFEQDLMDLKNKTKDLDIKSITDGIASLEEKFKNFPEQVELKDADEIKSLNDALNDLNKEVKGMKKDEIESKSLEQALLDLKNDEAFKTMASDIVNKKSAGATLELKANVLTTALTGDRQRSSMEVGVDKEAYRMPFMRQIIPNVPATEPVITWTERVTHTDGTGGVSEGAAAGSSDSTWEEKTRSVVTRGVNYKYSVKSFRNLPQLVEDLKQDVVREMELDVDNQILFGDGLGNNFFGIAADSTEFDIASVGKANKVKSANLADLIRCMVLQVTNKHRVPTHAVVSPNDFADLELHKDANGNYILPPFMSANGTMISSVVIVQNTNVTANTCYVIDRASARFYVEQDMQLQVWDQNEDDAIKRMKTVTLWFDGQVRVRENDKDGLVKCSNITTALANLDPDVTDI